jgi:S-formylglutathione hydrolase FrmB
MSRFRTIEISDPGFERDHLRFITVKSPHLKGRGDLCVFVPDNSSNLTALPVVILLHGVYGSAWSWALKSGVHLQAQRMINEGTLPSMIIAMPSDGLWGDGSAYLPHNGYDFEKWIVEDVPAVLQECIPQVSAVSPLFISGLSMGGFGALKLGAKYGHLFKGISAHSSITSLPQMKIFVEEEILNYQQADKSEEDIRETILRYRRHLPPLRFDCGVEDILIEHNRQLHQQLQEHDIPHQYFEYPGGHEWPYWEKHVVDSLTFFARILA